MMTYRSESQSIRSAAKEGSPMLREPTSPEWSPVDQEVFDRLIPVDHYLRRALAAIDFEQLRSKVVSGYSPDLGRPAEDPILMLKLEFLQYHDNLSDRQVIERAQTDVAYRYFLGVPMKKELPHPSSLCIFRGRLGGEGHLAVFHAIVAPGPRARLGEGSPAVEGRDARHWRRCHPDDFGAGRPDTRQTALGG